MLAVLVNTLAVLLGSTVGLLARKGIPEKVSGAIMTAISLCTLYAGVSGMLKGENTLVLIVSMVLAPPRARFWISTARSPAWARPSSRASAARTERPAWPRAL